MTTHRPSAKPKHKPIPEGHRDPMDTPIILPMGMNKDELKARLLSIKNYRSWALSYCPKQVVSQQELSTWLSRSGYDPDLAAEVVK